jgi:hypothetical protein
MRLLHAGFDTLDVAFQGAFPAETIEFLKKARDEAEERQEAVLVKIGSDQVAMHIEASGLRGGYAIRAHTGPLGEVLAFKANSDPLDWNGFASIRASALATYGHEAAWRNLLDRLARMGFVVMAHSVNRVDYAADFLAPGVELRLDGFIAHPRAKARPYWGAASNNDPNQPSAVLTGRRLESVTIGKMPGRQIIVYDKRAAAIAQRAMFWFRKWRVEPADPTPIFRVEVRAGKKELKERWNLRTFDEVQREIGDVIRAALQDIRYIAPRQTDTNVTRQRLDPLWQAMIEVVDHGLPRFRSDLTADEVKEIEREEAVRTYSGLIVGNAAPLAVALGMNDRNIESLLVARIARLITNAISHPSERFQRRVKRARERLHFVCDREH